MAKAGWRATFGLLAGMLATTGTAGASDTQDLSAEAKQDIKDLISYMAEDMPVVQGQQSTQEQRYMVNNIAQPLNDTLDGCYGTPTTADYAIALHMGIMAGVRTHSDALYISKHEAPFTELTTHIREAAQWLPHVEEIFAQQHPEATQFMDTLNSKNIVETPDTRMRVEAVEKHNWPETKTYTIDNVHVMPLQYFGPHSSMMAVPEFFNKVEDMMNTVNSAAPQFWNNVPTLPTPGGFECDGH